MALHRPIVLASGHLRQLPQEDVIGLDAVSPATVPTTLRLQAGDEMLIIRGGEFYRFLVSSLEVPPTVPANAVTVGGVPVTAGDIIVVVG